MGEVLSQNEIDDLLDALNTGVLDADEMKRNTKSSEDGKIKEYNFARPSKFAKEQLRTFEIMFENYARILSTTFTVYFRTSTQAEIISAEEVVYSEFTNSLPNPSILGIVDFSPLKGSIILEVSNKIGYAIVDRLLGGRGDTLEKVREFSDIEIAILERILIKSCNALIEPWENVLKLDPYLDKIETNPQYAQIVSSNEKVALVTLNLKIGEVEGLMNICLPYMVMEPVMDKFNTKFWFSNLRKGENKDYNDIIESKIEKTMIPISAVLGESIISVNDFVNLQVGDVIKLDTPVNADIKVFVGNKKKFSAKPGLFNNYRSIKIDEILREED